jgi:hypothetical protein
MKRILSFVLLLSSMTAFGQTTMFQSSLTLGDEQEQIMSYYPDTNPCRDQEVEIANKYISEALSSPLLKAIGISGFEKDVKTAINDNIEGAYNDERFNPVIYRVRIFYNDEFNKYLHKIIKTTKVRDLLFDISSSIICDLCKLYPKDFKADVVNKLNRAISFVSTMKNHKYEAVNLDTWMEEQKLYIDGKENEEIALGLEGFLIRRVITDGFTIPELSNYLEKLLKMVDAVDVSDNSDVLSKVSINNDLTYYTTASGNYYLANKTNVKVFPYNPEITSMQRYGLTKLQCIKDKNSNMYKISNGLLWGYPEKKWELYEHPDVKGVILIDDTGDVIMRE